MAPFCRPDQRKRIAAALVFLLAACLLSAAPAAVPPRSEGFTLEDLLTVEPVGETALSPDGKTIAVTRYGQIALMPAAGGWPAPLTGNSGHKSGFSWSPDGSALAYASEGSIWTVAAAGGQPRRLTHAPPGRGDPRQAADRGPRWSPKGRWILFETGRTGHNSLMVVSADGKVLSVVAQSASDAGSAAWAPSGDRIAYVERATEYFSGRLRVVHFNPESGEVSGEAEMLYTAPVDRGGGWSMRGTAWSPDGKSIALVLQNTGWSNLYLVPAAGGEPKQITHGAFDDGDPVFSPSGGSLAVMSNRGLLEADRIWIVPLDGSAAHPLAEFPIPGVESYPQFSPDGKKMYFHRESPLNSADLYVTSLASGSTPEALTHTLPLTFHGRLQVPEKVTFKSKDGLDVSGLVFKPRSLKAGTPGPGVLWIHGGPEGEDVYRLDLWAQYLAQAGYAVLEPNYRGSNGYGEHFRNLNVEDPGGGEADDVAAGAHYLVAHELADPKRLAIGGGSHGGTMVAYVVARYPELFQAAIEMYGVVDRALFVERTNANSSVRWMMKMGGSPAEKPEIYRKADILLDVATIRTPLLILHGENDPQVPPAESAEFAKALKEHGKVYYYFTYPGELHGFSQPAHRLDAWRKELAFLEHYINPRYGTDSTSTEEVDFPTPSVANSHMER